MNENKIKIKVSCVKQVKKSNRNQASLSIKIKFKKYQIAMARLNRYQIKYQLKDYTHHEFLFFYISPTHFKMKNTSFSLCIISH